MDFLNDENIVSPSHVDPLLPQIPQIYIEWYSFQDCVLEAF